METILQNIDWMALLSAIWTIILVPIGKQIYEWLKSKKLDKYATILYDEVVKAVKSVYETTVKDIKGRIFISGYSRKYRCYKDRVRYGNGSGSGIGCNPLEGSSRINCRG